MVHEELFHPLLVGGLFMVGESEGARLHSAKRFVVWYARFLGTYLLLEGLALVVFAVAANVRVAGLTKPFVLFFAPAAVAGVLIYISSRFAGRPKIRAGMFTFGVFVYFILLLPGVSYSLSKLGFAGGGVEAAIVPTGVLGSILSAACVYVIARRRLDRGV